MAEHFRDEESLYSIKGIGSFEHINLHKQFSKKIKFSREALINNEGNDNLTDLLRVYRELLDWFMEHIKVADKEQWERLNE